MNPTLPGYGHESAEHPPELRPGDTLGKYRIVRVIGEGGMGVVFEAEDTILERPVALKTLLPGRAQVSPTALPRFLAEARAVAGLRHPNIVPLYEVGEHAGAPFLVMEMVPGGNAEQRVRAGGPMPWPEATRTAADVCRALAHAHAAGMIHRDVKPANVLIDEAGAAKLADFGLVKSDETAALKMTVEGMPAGSPIYTSPEQCRGEPADARTDLYSLGATYHLLLTGRPPYPATNAVALIFAHCHSPPPDPRAADPAVPEGCAAVIARAMAKNPDDRFADAAEMLAALESLLPARRPRPDAVATVEMPGAVGSAELPVPAGAGSSLADVPMPVVMPLPVPPVPASPYPAADFGSGRRRVGPPGAAIAAGGGAGSSSARSSGVRRMARADGGPAGGGLGVAVGSGAAVVVVGGAILMWLLGGRGEHKRRPDAAAPAFASASASAPVIQTEPAEPPPPDDPAPRPAPSRQPPPASVSAQPPPPPPPPVESIQPQPQPKPQPSTTARPAQPAHSDEAERIRAEFSAAMADAAAAQRPEATAVSRWNAMNRLRVFHFRESRCMSQEHRGWARQAGDEWNRMLAGRPELLPTPIYPGENDRNLLELLAMPAAQRAATVDSIIMALNPGSGGGFDQRIEGGKVVSFSAASDFLFDVSPLLALRDLRTLRLAGGGPGKGRLADVTGLRRLAALTTLAVPDNPRLVSVAWLAGLPLRSADLSRTGVSDLSPLANCPLEELLIAGTPVADLSPLKGLKLTRLDIRGTRVADLSPLKGMPLAELSCDAPSPAALEVLKAIPTLKTYNGKPAAETLW